MLEITFLGTSGSTPTVERGMPAIALKWAGKVFLWDCGEGTQQQMMKYRVGYGSLKAVFISHLHLDHFVGLYGLIETFHLTFPAPKKLTVFAPKGLPLLNKRPFVELKETMSGSLWKESDFEISAFPVRHGKSAYGFVFRENDRIKFNAEKAHAAGLRGKMFTQIQKKGSLVVGGKTIRLEDVSWIKPGRRVVYSGDCSPSKRLITHANRADILIHESTFGKEHATEAAEHFHSTAEDAAKVAKAAGVKQLILTHISPRYKETKELLENAKAIFNNTIIAYDGLKVVL